jgi:hypothetical protein
VVSGTGSNTPNYSVVLGLNVPIGGGPRKDIKKALSTQVRADQLAFERTYASVCANLDSESYDVEEGAQNLAMLKSCKTEITKRPTAPKPLTPPAPAEVTPPPVVNNNSDLEQLKRENAELRLLIAQLAEKLDKGNTVNGGGY